MTCAIISLKQQLNNQSTAGTLLHIFVVDKLFAQKL
jgi:hypothetical protein